MEHKNQAEEDAAAEKDWQEFWREICTKEDGSIDLEQIKRELSDFRYMIEQVPRVYMHVTGGMMSKQMYDADDVIAMADDHINNLRREWEEELEDMKTDDPSER